jgi:hypothetical protein
MIATIFGNAGLGKTSLAASFPNPIFIRTEDGTQSLSGMDVALFPVATTSQMVFDNIKSLFENEHDFETLVIDSITQLNIIIENEVIEADPKAKNIATAGGGYGAGYSMVAMVHQKVREWCGHLSTQKNMNIVFVCHSEIETITPPDSEDYGRWNIKLHKKSMTHYVDNADLVGYLKLQTFTTTKGDKAKATSTNLRLLTCYPQASHVSKNRYGISEDVVFELGQNPLSKFLTTKGK